MNKLGKTLNIRSIGSAMLFVAFIVAGCGEDSAVMPNPEISLKSESDRAASSNACERMVDVVCRESAGDGVAQAKLLTEAFLGIELDESSYFARAESLGEYFKLVTAATERLLSTCSDSENAWRFKFGALSRINDEIRKCENEPLGGQYDGGSTNSGLFLTQKQYLKALEKLRFDFVRNGFETGPFVRYYYSLPDGSRALWLHDLERLAARKVVIWNPNDQFVELPGFENDMPENGDATEFLGGGRSVKMHDVRK